MLCWICNVVDIPEVILDPRDGKIRHCHVCEGIIQENLQMLSGERLDDGEVETLIEPEESQPDNVFQQGFYSPSE